MGFHTSFVRRCSSKTNLEVNHNSCDATRISKECKFIPSINIRGSSVLFSTDVLHVDVHHFTACITRNLADSVQCD